MNTVETIQSKLIHLPPKAQEEVLGVIERIEARYRSFRDRDENGNSEGLEDIFDQLAEIQIDGPADLAERHDFYAHGKVEG